MIIYPFPVITHIIILDCSLKRYLLPTIPNDCHGNICKPKNPNPVWWTMPFIQLTQVEIISSCFPTIQGQQLENFYIPKPWACFTWNNPSSSAPASSHLHFLKKITVNFLIHDFVITYSATLLSLVLSCAVLQRLQFSFFFWILFIQYH